MLPNIFFCFPFDFDISDAQLQNTQMRRNAASWFSAVVSFVRMMIEGWGRGRFLMATTRVLGDGFAFAGCFLLVLMEEDFEPGGAWMVVWGDMQFTE